MTFVCLVEGPRDLTDADWQIERFRKKNNVDLWASVGAIIIIILQASTVQVRFPTKIEISIKNITVTFIIHYHYVLIFKLQSYKTCLKIGFMKSNVYSFSFIAPSTRRFSSPPTISRLIKCVSKMLSISKIIYLLNLQNFYCFLE